MKTHMTTSYRIGFLDENLEEFQEIQDRLNVLRLEIIPILEKQLKRVALKDDERNKLMIYNDLEGKLVDLRQDNNRRSNNEKMYWLCTDKMKPASVAVAITVDTIREDTIEDYNYLEFDIVDPDEKPIAKNMHLIKIGSKKECEGLITSYKRLNELLNEVRERDFSLLELFYIKFKSAQETARLSVVAEIEKGNRDLDMLMFKL